MAKTIKIRQLTHKTIKPFGCIIDRRFIKDGGIGDKFGVLLKEKSKGWRIGYLVLRKKAMMRLESHPDSLETFEPVKGRPIIALAPNKAPGSVKLFLLDKPIVVKKGVWHDVMAASRECEMKIFENNEVKIKYHNLKDLVIV